MKEKKLFAKPVLRSRLHDEIVAVLQNKILSGALSPGEKIPPERELAETFSVNRATVREALRKLEILELLEIRHGDGLYVKNYLDSGNLDIIKAACNSANGKAVILDILEARRFIAPQIAVMAAKRRLPEDLEQLKNAVSQTDLIPLEKDIQIHQIIARLSHNVLCVIGLNFFNQIFRDYGHLYFQNEQNVQRSRQFYQDIYKAIQNRQPEQAHEIMTNIMVYAEEVIKAGLNENGLAKGEITA